MRRSHFSLLAVLIFYSSSVFAQITLSVDILGINEKLTDNVRQYLTIEQQKNHTLISEARIRRLHKKAQLDISKALQPYGYYRPVIRSELIERNPDQWQATYTIEHGEPLPISELNFIFNEELKNDDEFQLLLSNTGIKQGDTFNHIKYESLKSNLARISAERGYFNAKFIEHRVEIDLDIYEARVFLNYDSGPRYNFGEVLMKQDLLDPELLKRYIPFDQGNPYTLNEIIEMQQVLNDSDFFRTVEVSPAQPLIESREIPISVVLTPRRQNIYTLGLGYGTDTGARTKVGWEVPRLNREGHRINTELRISEIGYKINMTYKVPVFNPRTDQIVYNAGIINEKTDTSDSTVRTVGVSLNRSHGFWRQSIALNYQQENFLIADQSGRSTLVIPSINWSRTWGNNFLNVLDGMRFDIGLRGASDALLSDTDFAQLQGGIKAITSLGSNMRIISRGRLGSTYTDEFNQLPSSVRFFTGGGQSVRGYSYNSLGPVDENGKVKGAKNLMVGSIEIEHKLAGKWSAALFYDAGNAIDDFNDKLERGSGFGFRWNSPIGPVRIDLAKALGHDDLGWRLHINIGPDL